MATQCHLFPLLKGIHIPLPTAPPWEAAGWACPDPGAAQIQQAPSNARWTTVLDHNCPQFPMQEPLTQVLHPAIVFEPTGFCPWGAQPNPDLWPAVTLIPDNSTLPSQTGNAAGDGSHIGNLRHLRSVGSWYRFWGAVFLFGHLIWRLGSTRHLITLGILPSLHKEGLQKGLSTSHVSFHSCSYLCLYL